MILTVIYRNILWKESWFIKILSQVSLRNLIRWILPWDNLKRNFQKVFHAKLLRSARMKLCVHVITSLAWGESSNLGIPSSHSLFHYLDKIWIIIDQKTTLLWTIQNDDMALLFMAIDDCILCCFLNISKYILMQRFRNNQKNENLGFNHYISKSIMINQL